MKIIICLIFAVCFVLFYPHDGFSLQPMVDLSGKWSGTVQMQDSYGYCAYVGSVTATLQQDGNALSGSYVFTVTSAKPTGRLEGLESCSLDPYSGNVKGTVDGALVILTDSAGLGFSGSATSDMLTLNFSDQYVIGTAKLQKFASFTTPQKQTPKESEQDVNQMVQAGRSYLNQKQFDKALEYFNKITAKEPNNVIGWMGKGVSLVGLKNYDQAITYFKKSLELSPNNKDVLRWLGITYYMKGDCKTSVDYYSAALRSDPQNAKLLTEKKVVDACLTKQIEPKTKPSVPQKPEAKPETTTKPEAVKLDYASIKSTLDKIKDPTARANRALEILRQLPAGPIPDDLQKLFSDDLYRKLWLSLDNKALLIDKLPAQDGAVNEFKPSGRAFNDKPVYFINGVWNTIASSDDSAKMLADLLERPVKRVYNKSDGQIADLVESGKLKVGMLNDNPSVQSLVSNIMHDLQKGETVEIHAHSEGAIITSAALGMIQEYYPDFFAKYAHNISVNTYGGASWTYPEGPTYNHATFASDIVAVGPGRATLGENLLFKTNPGKLYSDLRIGVKDHAYASYLDDLPRFIINHHINDANPRQSLGNDLANYNPKLISGVFKELSYGHDEVAHYYVKNLDDAKLKTLPKSLLTEMKTYLESGSMKESDITSLNKVNRALGIK